MLEYDVESVGLFILISSVIKTVLLLRNGLPSSKVKVMAAASAESEDRVLVGRVSRLKIYPVKSTAGVEVKELNCTSEGASIGSFYDRQFMVTSGTDHVFLTARTAPRLLLIQPSFTSNNLKLDAPDMQSIEINPQDVLRSNDVRKTAVHGGVATGLDCGQAVAEWLNNFLDRPDCRLLYSAPSCDRRSVNGGSVKYAAWTKDVTVSQKMNFQDSTPYHLLSESSVQDLNAKLSCPVSTQNFRANIIVADSKPFTEDTWNKVYIGETEMSILKLCGRCIITTADPETGERLADNEPLKSLRSYRKLVPSFGDSPCLGTNLNIHQIGRIKVGDSVYAVIGSPKISPGA